VARNSCALTVVRDVSHGTSYIVQVNYFLLKAPDGRNFYIDVVPQCCSMYILNFV